jgi:HK97 family phage major capsid protein
MSRILQLKQRKAELTKEAGEILAAPRADERDLTADERGKHDAICQELDQVNATIEVEERQLKLERELEVPGRGGATTGSAVVGAPNFEKDPRKGFASHTDFLMAVLADSGHRDRSQVSDERLRFLAQSDREDKQAAGELAYMLPAAFTPRMAVGSDEQGEYSDTYGGFAIETIRLPGMLKLRPEADPTAGRTQPVPMASPSVEILARTDKDHSSYVSGGFTVSRKPETVAASASRGAIEMVTMKASGLWGLSYVTEELLSDSPISFAAILQSGVRDQFGAYMLNEKIRGKGGAEYLGVLTALAASSLGPTLSIAKETGQVADTIVTNNVIKMAARCWGFENAIWIANHTCKPQLFVLNIPIGTSGVMLYQPSRGDGFPDMLLGRPVFYSEYASAIGDVGDIILGNWGEYLDGLYQPLRSAESVHVRFVNHERTFKFWLRNCGAPWWRSALTPNKGVTLSPFVILAAR